MKKSMIYTKGGDKGKTSLVGGSRVSKTHIRLEAYGTTDELNSYVGWLNCAIKDENTNAFLLFVQHRLFNIGAYLASETEKEDAIKIDTVTAPHVERIEQEIDRIDALLPKINRFILPGGNEAASRAHICRTITRRSERLVYRVAENFPVAEEIFAFLNRLSDYFFVLARYESNKTSQELYWEKDNI